MIEYKYKNKINSLLKKNSKIREIYNNRLSLAFCPRWFNFNIPESPFITKYPVLKTIDGGIVSQYEKTIFIREKNIDILN